ncbi:hypothetical protein QR680_003007 [Steinernema hermaphroditum]|uniref:Selenocysteine lyase n=1 Tax=Steinernema hermaphroditum TaxID=289476 RepID=A0AA39LJC3_9BILA|nr:hypothetical protein QR680_003007 [Steinernema hermaphroditum]
MEPVYLDHNATTPLHSRVKKAIVDSLETWGNPSSSNKFGEEAKSVVEQARRRVAKLFATKPKNIIFTSGGTETNNWIITAAIDGFTCASGKRRVITSAIEHPSVQIPLRMREQRGDIELFELPIDNKTGMVDIQTLAGLINENTCLVTVMLANNETGVYQPLKEISRIVHDSEFGAKIIIHSDVAQVVGKRRIELEELGVDVVTVVGHKFYAPRIGALVWNDASRPFTLEPLFYGGGQEDGRRSGTENTPMIAGFGIAAEEAADETKQQIIIQNKSAFQDELKRVFGDDVQINFEESDRLENTVSASFLKSRITACDIVDRAETFIASTGAACHATSVTPSAVLLACGISEHDAMRTIRFSFGTTPVSADDINRVVEELRVLTTVTLLGTVSLADIYKTPMFPYQHSLAFSSPTTIMFALRIVFLALVALVGFSVGCLSLGGGCCSHSSCPSYSKCPSYAAVAVAPYAPSYSAPAYSGKK